MRYISSKLFAPRVQNMKYSPCSAAQIAGEVLGMYRELIPPAPIFRRGEMKFERAEPGPMLLKGGDLCR